MTLHLRRTILRYSQMADYLNYCELCFILKRIQICVFLKATQSLEFKYILLLIRLKYPLTHYFVDIHLLFVVGRFVFLLTNEMQVSSTNNMFLLVNVSFFSGCITLHEAAFDPMCLNIPRFTRNREPFLTK